MSVLFLSHSSKDDAAATALEAWLRKRGFTDIFVDHSAIAGGEKWAQALRDASGACRVVVCLVTERWLASDECFAEFKAAWYMGKRVIPLLAVGPEAMASNERLAKVLAEDQGFDVAACVDEQGRLELARRPEVERRLETGLRAAGALAKVGLDPQAFAIDRKLRPTPFPGLSSFGDEDADAALFYGRSREIADALEEIRKVRAERDLRPFVILGASGAGKSSLLKAGVIPRLRREAPAWLPLRAFRPGADPLLNFADALAHTFADFGKLEAHGVIRDRLIDAWRAAERSDGRLTPEGLAALESALESEGRRLRAAAGRDGATVLISVDQAEEMARADGDSGEALADYLRAALAATASRWQLAFTIRTDSFPELQSHRRFQELKARGYDLRAVPVFRFDSVVEEPAKRYGVEVDNALVDALMDDAPKEDALPLLAFALQRLWRQYAASGALSRANYDRVGGLRGLIEDAAERALRGLAPEEDVALPAGPPTKARIDLAASTFVPALAQINDQGATIRRIAAWSSFSEEQQDLLIRFDQWRLVVRKGEAGTVEVAHEALFREWSRLMGWLEPERARLEALRSLQTDALTWDRAGRDAAFLNHRGRRLSETAALAGIEAYRRRMGGAEFEYLKDCQAAEKRTRSRARGVQALIYALLVGVIVGLIGWINQGTLKAEATWFFTERPYISASVRPYVLTADAERALKPLASFRECAENCPEMIVVPPGEFVMGSPATEPGRQADEGPQHKVSIARPFAVSRYDVTFADWDACVAVGECPPAPNGGWGEGARPVINVSLGDAQKYVGWLSQITGKPYRLLSEAEWEYAARAGRSTAYFWGDDVGVANADCIGCGSPWDGKESSPAGSFKPNAFGLYDMAGDVWQFVQDCPHATYDGAPSDGSVWTGGDCSRHSVRGGSSNSPPQDIRSARRYKISTDTRDTGLGFRVARTLLAP
ncbi:MAG: SUMF1/EgtB/PvdO family nonheme iron enzyme [Roseiarcus sp.]|jgi:formylglycine-generating enzyme required for sulfatase activity